MKVIEIVGGFVVSSSVNLIRYWSLILIWCSSEFFSFLKSRLLKFLSVSVVVAFSRTTSLSRHARMTATGRPSRWAWSVRMIARRSSANSILMRVGIVPMRDIGVKW